MKKEVAKDSDEAAVEVPGEGGREQAIRAIGGEHLLALGRGGAEPAQIDEEVAGTQGAQLCKTTGQGEILFAAYPGESFRRSSSVAAASLPRPTSCQARAAWLVAVAAASGRIVGGYDLVQPLPAGLGAQGEERFAAHLEEGITWPTTGR